MNIKSDFDEVVNDYWLPPKYRNMLYKYFKTYEVVKIYTIYKKNNFVYEDVTETINKRLLKHVMCDLVSEKINCNYYGFPKKRKDLIFLIKHILINTSVLYKF